MISDIPQCLGCLKRGLTILLSKNFFGLDQIPKSLVDDLHRHLIHTATLHFILEKAAPSSASSADVSWTLIAPRYSFR
jgi:hypothetical protein